jgi:hypothetical protein
MPLRIFDYKERTTQQGQSPVVQHQDIDTSQFVTWDDFDKRLKEKLQEIFMDKKKEVEIDG